MKVRCYEMASAVSLVPTRLTSNRSIFSSLYIAYRHPRHTRMFWFLDQGLKASEREGKPISGKYQIADGALQLSVYTIKGNQLSEVIDDHKTGAIKHKLELLDRA